MIRILLGRESHWRLELHRGHLIHPVTGRRCLALCDTDRNWIGVADVKPPPDRLRLFYHELAHAWITELHPMPAHERVGRKWSEEETCNLVALGESLLGVRDRLRVACYLRAGVEPLDVMVLPGVDRAIPVVGMGAT